MPRWVNMIELQDIIHREPGRHKTVVRMLKSLAQHEGWLQPKVGLPGEGEIQRLYEQARQIVRVSEVLSLLC